MTTLRVAPYREPGRYLVKAIPSFMIHVADLPDPTQVADLYLRGVAHQGNTPTTPVQVLCGETVGMRSGWIVTEFRAECDVCQRCERLAQEQAS